MAVRLILVEDLNDVHAVLLDLLNTVGEFKLIAALTTEAEANLWFEDHEGEWDLAIIDLVLAQGTGMGVIARAKMTPGTHVGVFSSYVSDGIRAHCMRLGADAVFKKGEQVKDLVLWCARLSKNGPQGLGASSASNE